MCNLKDTTLKCLVAETHIKQTPLWRDFIWLSLRLSSIYPLHPRCTSALLHLNVYRPDLSDSFDKRASQKFLHLYKQFIYFQVLHLLHDLTVLCFTDCNRWLFVLAECPWCRQWQGRLSHGPFSPQQHSQSQLSRLHLFSSGSEDVKGIAQHSRDHTVT